MFGHQMMVIKLNLTGFARLLNKCGSAETVMEIIFPEIAFLMTPLVDSNVSETLSEPAHGFITLPTQSPAHNEWPVHRKTDR